MVVEFTVVVLVMQEVHWSTELMHDLQKLVLRHWVLSRHCYVVFITTFDNALQATCEMQVESELRNKEEAEHDKQFFDDGPEQVRQETSHG